MASNSRVGSLYYEIVLDPAKFSKGATKVRHEQKELVKLIEKENKRVAASKSYADRYKDEKDLIRKLVMEKKISIQKGIELTRMATRTYKAEQKKHTQILMRAEEERLAAKKKAYAKRMRLLEKERAARLKAEGIEAGIIGKNTSINAHNAKLSTKLANAEKTFSRVTIGALKAGIAITTAVKAVQAFAGAVISFVEKADEKKKSMIVLTALYDGNADAAARIREEMVEYAKKTAFSVEQTMDLAIQLRALGFTAEETTDSLKNFGRLAFGDPAKLKLIAKAYSDVRAQGKLMMTEIRQFANQGVPILAKLSENLGVSSLELRNLIKNGSVGFDDVAKAVDDIAQSFGNVDEAGLKTFTGQMEAATEAWGQLQAKIAENTGADVSLRGMAEALNGLIEVGDGLMDQYARGEGMIFWMSEALPLLNQLDLISRGGGLAPMVSLFKSLDSLMNGGERSALANIEKDLEALRQGNAAIAKSKRDMLKYEEEKQQKALARDLKRTELAKSRAMAEAKIAAALGDDTALKTLEMQERIEKARAAGAALGGENAAYRAVKDEKRLISAEQQTAYLKGFEAIQDSMESLNKRAEDRTKALIDKAMSAPLPGNMRQNSVEEWIYLKTQRDNREKEMKEEARFQEAQRDAKQAQIHNLEALNKINTTLADNLKGL